MTKKQIAAELNQVIGILELAIDEEMVDSLEHCYMFLKALKEDVEEIVEAI